jgi:hypothetical protein
MDEKVTTTCQHCGIQSEIDSDAITKITTAAVDASYARIAGDMRYGELRRLIELVARNIE